MKQFVFVVALCGAFSGRAQDSIQPARTTQEDAPVVKNKKGYDLLPKKGDIALGFNTIPVLNMFLGIFKPTPAYTGATDLVQYVSASNNQIVGKYFLNYKSAVRVRVGINTLSGSVTNRVQDAKAMYDASFGTKDDMAKASLLRVEDKLTYQKSNLLVSVGYEKRRGYRRLQGVYGVELGIGNESAKQKIHYGNGFSDRYDVYYSTFTGSVTTTTVSPTSSGRTVRPTEVRYRGGLRVGVRGFIGIEYFIFSKISVAAEYGWGYSIVTRRAAKSKQEVYNNGQNGPEVFTEEVNIDSREVTRGFSVDNNNGTAFSVNNTLGGNTSLNGGAGALTLLFHF